MAAKKLAHRELQELAIRVMASSIPEARTDNKSSPLVGAVLVRADGTVDTSVDTAYRGELRQGDHAEFTLLERKHRSSKLDGCVLYATLEPCAPGARKAPKISCAERIVNARIKKVWIGVEDPDPNVDHEGIAYLKAHGVEFDMFDRDLQEQILETNRRFITEAKQRALEARNRETETVAIRPLTLALDTDYPNGLDEAALREYCERSGEDDLMSPEFQEQVVHQGLARREGDRLAPTMSGVLLFGRRPRDRLPEAGLLGTIHYEDGTEEKKDFDGPAVSAPELALEWLKAKLPNPMDRTQARRTELLATHHEVVREGIVNALVHRDYGIEGAKCQLVATREQVEIWSPGLPVEPITLEKLMSFEAPMRSRNRVLHLVFSRMDLAEERGLGLKSMKQKSRAVGLRPPVYTYNDPYIILTLSRLPAVAQDVLAKLSDAERAGWDWLRNRDVVTTSEYEKEMGVPNRTAKNHVRRMTQLGLLRMEGAGRATRYVVVRPKE